MTPEQEDSILRALRPLCPNQTPEQLRSVLKQVLPMVPQGQAAADMEAELISQFPDLAKFMEPQT